MKRKIKITNYFLLLFLMSSVFFAFKNNGDKEHTLKKDYFKLASNLTENDYSPDIIIFKLKEKNRNAARVNEIDNAVLNAAINNLGSMGVKKMFAEAVKPQTEFSADGEKMADLSLIYIMKFTSPMNIEDAINEIYSTGEVEYAQPKYINKLLFTPNDPSLGSQYFINKVQCPAGWEIQQGDTNVVIGIIDTGTDWDHPDLAGNIKYNYADPINGIDDDVDGYIDNYRGWDIANNDNDPMVDGNSHGSHVSGCAAAITNNSTGVSSPGFKCKFLPVKVTSASTFINEFQGIKYAADHGCSIINCSWGGGGAGPFEQDIITYASINKNSLVVCAAGNNNSSLNYYPASLKYVMSVASTNSSDIKSSFSNYGTSIDVCAPGSGIYSTIYNDSYASLDGTSMASPVTAGTCAIIKSQFPGYTGLQVGEKVRVTCDNIDAQNPSYTGKLGMGRINMLKALTINSPSLRLNSYVVTDGNNNVPQPNDTISIVGTFKNYLDATVNATVVLTSSSSALTMLNSTSNLGAVSTLGTVTNSSSPFKAIVNSSAPPNTKVEFKLLYTDGSYSDFEYFSVTINPLYASTNTNNITTTINGKGNFGYNDYPDNTQGDGFKFRNGLSLSYEGGLICATSNSIVSDCVRESNQNIQSTDFTNILPFQITQPGVISSQDGNSKFNDDGAGASKIGIEISFSSYEFTSSADSDYVIMKYKIKNTTSAAINNFYAGLFDDWDIGSSGGLNRADWDAVNQMGYIWRTDNNPGTYVGVALLSASNPGYWAIDNDNTVSGNPWGIYDGFTDQEKYQSMSSGIGRQQAGGTSGRDVANVVGSGPYTIPANGEITVVFALIAGDNLNDLKANCVAAKNKYNSVVGISNFNSQIPEKYSLSQNYPNPFNPVTNLEFGISKSGFVSLKVYDMLGKEIATLVNENLNPGTYKYNFDASDLTSGIYFYKLESDGFQETKRMLLIK